MSLSTLDKEFVAVGAAIGAGCHPCTQYHAQAALKADLSVEDALWAVQQALAVRAKGGIAVANVGRRILGAEQQELPTEEEPAGRGAALVRLGAAAGCNSGALLAGYAEQAVGLGVDGGELREAVGIAEMVKTQAGKFLQHDAERILRDIPDSETVRDGPSATCCAAQETPQQAEVAGPSLSPSGPQGRCC